MQYTAAENAAITQTVSNAPYAMPTALPHGNPDTFKVIRRNGQVTNFDIKKIETAMTKAFFDVEGTGAEDSSRIHECVKILTDTVETCLFRRVPSGGVIHIEDIQDQVELALMRQGEQKVARSYVIYREEHAKLRSQNSTLETALEPKIYVLTDTGERKPLDEMRLKTIVAEAVEGLSGVDSQILYHDAVRNLFDGVPEKDVSAVFIMAARVMIEKDPNYSFVAARLLQDSLRREALSFLNESESEATLTEMQHLYSTYLEKTLLRAVELELIDPELLRYDLTQLGAALQAKRDQQFTYLGLQTLYDRYFIHHGNTRFELPQIFFMRVAMGLAINEAHREERAIEFYNLLSSFDFMSSTPTLFNSGTLRPQLSSCYLTTLSDDLEGIYNGIKDNALLSKFAGGLGNDWTQVRGLGAHIKGTNGQSQGVVPFLKVANDTAVAVNQGGKRKGAVCAYLETWHIDIEEFLELRKNTGDERRRTHDMNTANWIPDLFMKRVAEEQEWTLFSPDETPDLHDLYGKAFEAKYVEYEAKAARGEMKLSKTLAAIDLWRKMLGMLFETGHPWITFKDPCNIRYSNQHVGVVHSSNLCCITADQRVVTDKGILTVKELYELKCQNKVVGLEGIYNASEMLLPRPDAPIVEIQTREGYSHKVTPDHKVWVKDKGWVEAQDLRQNDKLLTQQLEGLWGQEHNPELSYSMGLIAGDGTFSNKTVHIDVWEHDFHFIESIEAKVHTLLAANTVLNTTSTNTPTFAFNHKHKRARLSSAPLFRLLETEGLNLQNKTRVPELIWKGSRETVAEYLRGLYQADGHIQTGDSITTLVLASKNLAFIKELQIIWANFGVKTSINKMRDRSLQDLPDGKGGTKKYWSQPLYRLLITSIQGCQIAEEIVHLGDYKKSAACERYKANLKKTGYQQKLYAHFTELTPLPNEDAYCLRVDSETHAWTVNGLVTKNTEIMLHTNADEISVCNLGSVNIAAHTTAEGLDVAKLERTITTAMRMLDNVIDYNYYSVPQAKRSNSLHRPVGIGMMGFQDALYKQNISYASQAAIEFADKSMEALSYFAIQGSNRLAVERGTYSTFEGSLWSQGILPIDSLDKLIEERGEYIQVDQSSSLDWASLRSDIQATGMRNSNVMAIAPTACVSGDTLILSSKGLIPIESLVEGQAQWQNIHLNIVQEGNLARANQLYLNGAKETLRITTKRGSEISATPNHRIRVIDQSGDYSWKYFSELTVGDEVVRRLGGHQTLLADKELLNLTVPPRQHYNEKNIQIPEKLDKDTAFMLGLYMGDGYLKYSNRNHYTKKEGLGFALHNSEEYLLNALRAQFSKWGATLLADLSKTDSACTTYLIFSSQLVRWFEANKFNKQRGNFGEGSASAFIPNKILESNSEVLCAFLSGLFVADGTVNNRCVEMATVSRTLAVQVKVALESLGILATLFTSKPGTKGNRPVHRVRTSNVEATRLFLKYIGFGDSVKHQYLVERLASCHSDSDARRGHNIHSLAVITDFIQASRQANVNKQYLNPLACSKTNGKMNIHLAQQVIADYPELQKTKLGKLLSKGMLYFEPIVSIEDSYDITYDLQVPEKHTYVANGFVSHNTISNICGVSQSIEPTYQNMFVKSNLSGEFMVINAYLVNDLKALGIWDEVMINDLKYDDGSLKKIDRIPMNLKDKYATAFEMDSRWLIEAASRRQKWIDQGQSLNLYMSEPSGAKLDNLYKLAWVRGLKTTYYLRSMGATHMEKTTERTTALSSDTPESLSVGSEAPQACSILDPDCDACQ